MILAVGGDIRFEATNHIASVALVIIHAADSLVTEDVILFAGIDHKRRVLACPSGGGELLQ